MPTTLNHDADLESLSALFDGELDPVAARFAAKRLDHDPQWREACGRWQLLGDALRGQATAVAPAGFADRVGAALRDAAAVPVAGAGDVAAPAHRRWIGGAALAASVAIAALLVVRPFSPPEASPMPAAPLAANAVPSPGLAAPAEVVARTSPEPDAPASGRPRAAPSPVTAVAATDLPPRAGNDLPTDPGRPLADAAIAATDTAPVEPAASHPFLPSGEIASRPWPRAALSGYPTGNAFSVSLDDRALGSSVAGTGREPLSASPSFYPFEPGMLDADSPSRPAPDGPTSSDWPQR
jgi:negative regulator of sigma E activity